MAAALGINIRRVFTLTFAAGTGLAGLGGALMTPVRGLLPTMGIDILPFAFVVVVLGGLGSLPGAILAGLLVGVVQSLMTADRKSTRLNSSHSQISYAVFCLKKKKPVLPIART